MSFDYMVYYTMDVKPATAYKVMYRQICENSIPVYSIVMGVIFYAFPFPFAFGSRRLSQICRYDSPR